MDKEQAIYEEFINMDIESSYKEAIKYYSRFIVWIEYDINKKEKIISEMQDATDENLEYLRLKKDISCLKEQREDIKAKCVTQQYIYNLNKHNSDIMKKGDIRNDKILSVLENILNILKDKV